MEAIKPLNAINLIDSGPVPYAQRHAAQIKLFQFTGIVSAGRKPPILFDLLRGASGWTWMELEAILFEQVRLYSHLHDPSIM